MRFPSLVFPLVLITLADAPLAQTVVVDDEPGPGVDFTNLQDAIDGVPSGATILLAPGFHAGGFTIDGKALRIEGSGDAQVQGVGIVRNLPADRAVEIAGITLTHSERSLLGAFTGTLAVVDDEGPVTLRDVRIDARFRASSQDSIASEEDSIVVRAARRVLFARCTLRGGEGVTGSTVAGAGLLAVDSRVALAGCHVTGGGGVAAPVPGGVGIEQRGGTLLLVGTTVAGGAGGSVEAPFCFDGQPGGAGLRLRATVREEPLVVLRRASVTGGAGGAASAPCVPGLPGAAREVLAGRIAEATPQDRGMGIR